MKFQFASSVARIATLVIFAGLATTSLSVAKAQEIVTPEPPANLRVLDVTETTVTVAWDPSPTPSSDFAGYTVSSSTFPGGASVDSNTTTAEITNLIPGRTYSFTVTAANADPDGFDSAPSNAVIAATLPSTDFEPPTVPGSLQASAGANGDITLTWIPSTDNVRVDHYRLTEFHFGVVTQVSALVNGVPRDSVVLNGFAPDTALTFELSAVDISGNESAPSNAALIQTPPGA